MTHWTKLTLNILVATLACPLELPSSTGYDRLVNATFAPRHHCIPQGQQVSVKQQQTKTFNRHPATPQGHCNGADRFFVGSKQAPPSTYIGIPTNATGAAKIHPTAPQHQNDPTPAQSTAQLLLLSHWKQQHIIGIIHQQQDGRT
jgi:hypothetical protein